MGRSMGFTQENEIQPITKPKYNHLILTVRAAQWSLSPYIQESVIFWRYQYQQ